MWQSTIQTVSSGNVHRVSISRGRAPLRYDEVLHGWQHDERFRTFFIELLAGDSFAAYRWETPPVTTATLRRAFEFVLLDAPGLDRTPDADAFANQFLAATEDKTVVAFPNLGNDAVLVVPRPCGIPSAYGHLAAFIRHAPAAQRHELWQTVSASVESRLQTKGKRPLWLSTAGMGVSWLHVRLDSRPKYYGFRPYADALFP